jgi:hypothetical protein
MRLLFSPATTTITNHDPQTQITSHYRREPARSFHSIAAQKVIRGRRLTFFETHRRAGSRVWTPLPDPKRQAAAAHI